MRQRIQTCRVSHRSGAVFGVQKYRTWYDSGAPFSVAAKPGVKARHLFARRGARCRSGYKAGFKYFLQHISVELNSENCRSLYVPSGCAHGFQTLAENSDVRYQMSDEYVPELAAGIRWDDPVLNIDWPGPVTAMNDRDAHYADLDIDWLRSLDWTMRQ